MNKLIRLKKGLTMLKQLVMGLALIISANTSFANSADHMLRCDDGNFSSVRLYLDAQSLSQTSDHFLVVGGAIAHMYSSTVSMGCDNNYYKKDGTGVLNCAGYYHSDDLTTMKVYSENGKIYVDWTTSESYGQAPMKTECVLESI